MKRLILTMLLFVVGVSAVSAQTQSSGYEAKQGCSAVKCSDGSQPVTSKFAIGAGVAAVTDHYLNTQEYTGPVFGASAEFGRFYRKSDKLSWRLSLSYAGQGYDSDLREGGLENAAATAHLTARMASADYAVYYNWLICERLRLRAGGSFNLYGDMMMGDENSINNSANLSAQAQIYAAAGLRYGWDFKKFGLDIYTNLAVPFMGLMTVDERYENFIGTVVPSEFNLKEYSHIKFSSMHNMQGINFDLGVEFALRRLSLYAEYQTLNRWWNAYQLQDYRKVSLFKVGVSVNFTSRQYNKTSERRF